MASDDIYFDSSSRAARKAMHLEGLKETSQHRDAAILWLRKNYKRQIGKLGPHQLINHFQNESAIINKGYLTETLAQHDQQRTKNSLEMSQFYRESYRLYDPAERQMFFSQLPEIDTADNLWIYKPGNNSRGRGIKIMWQFDELRAQYAALGQQPITAKRDQGIMQRYINNPLLLEGRKSELRVYWLIASLDPLLVLLYPEATVRLNSLPYKLDDFDNQLVHVTNVYQQKNHPGYDPSVVLKWKFEDLGRYLSQQLGITDADFLQAKLIPQIRRILHTVSLASRERLKLRYPKQGDCFAVFGADLMLDQDLNPWLLEVQKSPGLSFSDVVKRDVIPPMLGEAARIMLEIRNRRRNGQCLKGLQSVDKYQWVVNEAE
ncbi:ATP-grasp domain-containing protein [Parasedimentitalea psychrophila]|uniref:Tubulin-tyrosine ligase family protein n=1 Tax=Parasedimentitalea psychrophila TaxID=2997337 RepID=A0A9Y2L1Z7_9RHOB|nr:hypothetical protein [Parasedimentitalea psychrophila]WIY26196.1 hypothetical protein QPJ95_04535 [Parasedimentitalea psychrophila]